MRQSQIILGWMEEGRREGELDVGRDHLLKVIRWTLQDPVPDPIAEAIKATNDPALLLRWFDTALTSSTVAEFVAAMIAQP